MKEFDLIVIGSGPGGYVSAIKASQIGFKVALIEKDKPGGVCLNIGCIPSKALIHQAEVFSYVKNLEEMGLKINKSQLNYKKVFEKSRKAADNLSKGISFLIRKNNIEYIQGHAVIKTENIVRVNETNYKTKYILIATGSRPREIPAFKIDEKQILSSTGALMLEKLPKQLAILGAGAIGIEFAYIMNSFEVKVDLIEGLDRILPSEDKEITSLLTNIYKKRNINILTNTKALSMEKTNNKIKLKLNKNQQIKTLETEMLLIAIGRKANIENIGLENLKIETEREFIKVNQNYQTNIKNIYAIGDVIKSPLLAHIASKEGELSVEHMKHNKIDPLNYELNPSAVYSEPQIASFGKTEEQLKKENIKYKKFSFPYKAIGKASAIDKTEGLVKIIINPKTNEIYSAHIIGHQATELIHELLLAKSTELLPEDIAKMIHAHPTLSEGIMESSKGLEDLPIHI